MHAAADACRHLVGVGHRHDQALERGVVQIHHDGGSLAVDDRGVLAELASTRADRIHARRPVPGARIPRSSGQAVATARTSDTDESGTRTSPWAPSNFSTQSFKCSSLGPIWKFAIAGDRSGWAAILRAGRGRGGGEGEPVETVGR